MLRPPLSNILWPNPLLTKGPEKRITDGLRKGPFRWKDRVSFIVFVLLFHLLNWSSSLRRQRERETKGIECEWVDRERILKMASTEGLVPITRAFLASYYDKYPFPPLSDDVSGLYSDMASLIQLLALQSPPSQGSIISLILLCVCVFFVFFLNFLISFPPLYRGSFPNRGSEPRASSQNWWEYVEK